MTPVLIMQEVLPNDPRLYADCQSSFLPKIIEKEEDKLIQSKSHKDQDSTIEMQKKTYLEVPPKVKIFLLNEGNYSPKVIDQPTSYTDHKLKTNIIESTEAHKFEINTTKPNENKKSEINITEITENRKLKINTTELIKDHKQSSLSFNLSSTFEKLNKFRDLDVSKTYLKVPSKVKISLLNERNHSSKIIDQSTSYTDHKSKINTIESIDNRFDDASTFLNVLIHERPTDYFTTLNIPLIDLLLPEGFNMSDKFWKKEEYSKDLKDPCDKAKETTVLRFQLNIIENINYSKVIDEVDACLKDLELRINNQR